MIVGQIAIGTGIKMYNGKYVKGGERILNLGIPHGLAYFTILLILESLYRLKNWRDPQNYLVPETKMTINEFNTRV